MIYIDIDNSDDQILINRNLSEDDLNNKNLIIIDNDINKIRKYYSSKKDVLIYNKSNSSLNDMMYYEDNVYAFNHIDEFKTIMEVIKEKKRIRKRNNLIIELSLIIFFLFTIIINNTVILKTDNKIKKNDNKTAAITEKTKKAELQETEQNSKKVDLKKENYVFYGDSITQCYDIDHFFPDLPVVNTAHWGYLTPQLLDEVEERVLDYNPTKVFLLMGTNDLGYSDSTDEEIFENIKKLVHIIKKDRKNVKIYVESIYPVNETINIDANVWHIRENARIRNINSMLKDLCEKEKLTYIDLYDVLKEEDGSIKDEYTVEGLHITYEGYQKITETIDKYVREA